MRPAIPCRPVRLVPFRAVLSGLRAAEVRPMPPKSAWFVCKRFAPKQAKRSHGGVLGGVTVGAAVLSCGVQAILDEGVDDESVCGGCDGSDRKAAGATSGRRGA